MSTVVSLVCVLLSLGWGGPGMAQDRPLEIVMDHYLLEGTEALDKGETDRARRAFEKIEALEVEPPPAFLFEYGQLLLEHGTTEAEVRKGEGLLNRFIAKELKEFERDTATVTVRSRAAVKIEHLACQADADCRAAAERAKAEQADAERRRQVRRHQFRERLRMVSIPGGSFMMGCTGEQHECDDDEDPVHVVQVNDFEMGQYEVTQALWEAVMGENPSAFTDCAQCPVEKVSWEDVRQFLKKLNVQTEDQYRLPTEAEWEYAARGGQQSRGYEYPGSHTPGVVAWYQKNSGNQTHPVGQKEPNELGLYDMSGNVEEWVEDCWHDSYMGAPADGWAWTSENSGDCSLRVLRGGSWNYPPRSLRAANRGRFTTGVRYTYFGFRVARTLTP